MCSNIKKNCGRETATNLKAELKEIANVDYKMALHNNPCIIMMEEKKRKCKNADFSKYYGKLMKENILLTHKIMLL